MPLVSAVATIVSDDRKLLDKLLEEFAGDVRHVDIGIHSISGEELVTIATANEFGAMTGKNRSIVLPARPFVRSTMDENQGKYERQTDRELRAVLDGQKTIVQAFEVLGLLVETGIRNKIRTLKVPANAQSTIDRKGSDNPLIDEETMLNSVRYVVKTGKGNKVTSDF